MLDSNLETRNFWLSIPVKWDEDRYLEIKEFDCEFEFDGPQLLEVRVPSEAYKSIQLLNEERDWFDVVSEAAIRLSNWLGCDSIWIDSTGTEIKRAD